jgi:predicted Zn-dependent protease
MKQLQTADIPTVAISVSHSNLGGQLPLATRFIGTTLSRLFSEPSLLAKPLPENWETRRKALYLENFFQKEKVHELYLQLLTHSPEDASASYALYQSFRELKKGTEALEALVEAVRLEPAYGAEYLTLSSIALEKKRPDQALKMLDLAIAAFPDNPFIQIQKAEMLIALENVPAAIELLEELKRLPWSEVYYPQLPSHLDSLLTLAREES